MARSRNIKPGFFSNEYLAELPPMTRLLFAGLWCLADREGRLEDRPRKIKAETLPFDDCDVDKLLDDLMNAEEQFIVRYELDGKRYIQIINFHKHQNPHRNEVSSIIPPLDSTTRVKDRRASSIGESARVMTSTTRADSLNLIPDSLNLIPLTSPRSKGGEEVVINTEIGKVNLETLEPVDLTPDEILPDGPMAIGTQSVNWAEKNWGRMLSPGETDSIIAWCDEFSIRGSTEPDAVIVEALKHCLDADARNMNYLRAVLTDWRDHKVLSVAQVEAREAERKSQKMHKPGNDPGDKPRPPGGKKSNKYDDFYL